MIPLTNINWYILKKLCNGLFIFKCTDVYDEDMDPIGKKLSILFDGVINMDLYLYHVHLVKLEHVVTCHVNSSMFWCYE